MLSISTKDLKSVQSGFRSLMRKLHPDKAGSVKGVPEAAELAREAKEACERAVSREEVPAIPRNLRHERLCSDPGRRKFRLHWTPPPEATNVRRYIVQVFDPAYGRALTVAVLEPDYSEELRRFVSMEEITTYVLSEEDLQKMPKLWTQSEATVQVAAANQAGQSQFAAIRVPLCAPPTNRPTPARAKPVPGSPMPRGRGGAAGKSGEQSPCSSEGASEAGELFEQELHRLRNSITLRPWLASKRKPVLVEWLKSRRWQTTGTKEDIIARIIYVLQGTSGSAVY